MPTDIEDKKKVLVSGLPEGATKNQVHLHFQKIKNGGGEIERVTLLAGGKAAVVFANPRGLFVFSINHSFVFQSTVVFEDPEGLYGKSWIK